MLPRGQITDASRRLLLAVLSGSKKGVKGALRDGGRPEGVTRGENALMAAAILGHADIIDLLLEAGASVTATGVGGWTALAFAAKQGSPTVAQRLIDAGSSVSSRTLEGDTPLHFAHCGQPAGSRKTIRPHCL